jgi:hypothetical protein
MEVAGKDLTYNEAYKLTHTDESKLLEVNKLFNKTLQEATKQTHVCIDMTMLSFSSRRKMLSVFSNFTAYSKVFLTDVPTIYSRNEERTGKYIPSHVFDSMTQSFVIPTIEEGFEDVEIFL